MSYKTTILIPARMESTRFPGKPLAPIEGVPMIVYCARNAISTGLETYVCTDSKEIQAVCNLYNIKSIITSNCETGTDRIAEAMEYIDSDFFINYQGDEPLIDSESLNNLIDMIPLLLKEEDTIITCVSCIDSKEAFDPTNVKCAIIRRQNRIQYFSRKPLLNSSSSENKEKYYKQIGVYALSKRNLKKFSELSQGELEKAEKVELMRWLENGKSIACCFFKNSSISVDTPQNLVEVLSLLAQKNSEN